MTNKIFYHLAGPILAPGATIKPGNWGRILRGYGWDHGHAIREAALEAYRQAHHPDLPSRLKAAFVFLTIEEMHRFRKIETGRTGFEHHCRYAVRLAEPSAACFVADYRLCSPFGPFRPDWPELYWRGIDSEGNPRVGAVPGGSIQVTPDARGPYREMLTLSDLIVEKRFDDT